MFIEIILIVLAGIGVNGFIGSGPMQWGIALVAGAAYLTKRINLTVLIALVLVQAALVWLASKASNS